MKNLKALLRNVQQSDYLQAIRDAISNTELTPDQIALEISEATQAKNQNVFKVLSELPKYVVFEEYIVKLPEKILTSGIKHKRLQQVTKTNIRFLSALVIKFNYSVMKYSHKNTQLHQQDLLELTVYQLKHLLQYVILWSISLITPMLKIGFRRYLLSVRGKNYNQLKIDTTLY